MKYLLAFCLSVWALFPLHAATNTIWTNIGISEFMATNVNTIQDVDGDASPWIEIYNPTATNISLNGWALATATNNLQQWIFPNITLTPGDFIVVFASGKDRTNNVAELHTNFRLPIGGGYLALVNASTNVVSSFTYPLQQADISYGSDGATPNLVGYFSVPTPDAANSMTGDYSAPPVVFSRTGRTFTNSFSLTLSNTNGATIYYTTNGSFPTQESTLYKSAITISLTTQVRARTFLPGLLPGPIHTETFLLLNSNLYKTNSNLPAIVIYNFNAGPIQSNVDEIANISIYEPTNTITSLTNAPTFNARALVHLHGSSTLTSPKQSCAIDFVDELNQDTNCSPLAFPEESDFILYGPDFYEPVLTHNPLIYQLSNDVGRYASRTRYVEVYLNTNGGALLATNYNGIYVLEEKIKWDANRVDISKTRSVDELHPLDNTLPNVSGGYIAKIDRLDVGETGFSTDGFISAFDYPEEADLKTPQRAPQIEYLTNYMNDFAAALNSTNYTDPILGYRQFIDVPSWIDYHILNVMAFNVDAFYLSAYYYKDRNDVLHYGPIWDFDRSQGSRDLYDFNPITWGQSVTQVFGNTWWPRLFSDVDFWQAWIDEYQNLRTGPLSTNHIYATIDSLVAIVAKEEPREAARWPSLTAPRTGTITTFGYTYAFPGTYQGEVNFEKQWYKDRLNFIDTNFLAKPLFSITNGAYTNGQLLTITAPNAGTIYYTTNNTDPRLPGGAISSNALIYSSSLVPYSNLVVYARMYNTNHHNLTGSNNPITNSFWSGFTLATFFPGAVPAITQSPNDLDAYLGQSPTFTVTASGEPAPTYRWYFKGVALTNQTNTTFTLTLTNGNQAGLYSVTASNHSGVATASFTLNITSKPDLVITEVMSSESKGADGSTGDHEDWWELSNLGTFPVNLQGFRFDDSHDSLADADVITNAVSIQPGESIVLVEDMTAEEFQTWWGISNLPPTLQIITYPSIGFSSDGDAIYLWNAAATNNSDTIASVTFPAATRGVSFGYDPQAAQFGALSEAGNYGAFAAAVNGDVGSPGTFINLPLFTQRENTTPGFNFTFVTQADYNYQIQYTTDLSTSDWTVLTNFTAASNSYTFTDQSASNDLSRFYRIVLTP